MDLDMHAGAAHVEAVSTSSAMCAGRTRRLWTTRKQEALLHDAHIAQARGAERGIKPQRAPRMAPK